ncbi:DUF5667 domain-containing protein [Mesobacillus subterraneus]|uniref:DUF5667 domain-containing protein n=1 Tax=Mesobacillus subterraneus TaxID=285983 RepID=UPI0020415169|nr:DUF5667 domain-containing protein [Mesobacillus subterraneus]MCM3663176.1 DUF5667 domain-containing protein [Mesobacillus subterraneus]MCM3682650.1 DUF5667 domain-containing protein [Mesobacillus subterraneus]
MKKLSNQEMKKIAKSTLALVLAGTFTFSPIAMAEENTSELETVELQTVSPNEIEEAKTQVEELEETNPTLIPGDFFYFAKIALEKIKLAFTFDNAKEAELLSTYASERLAEASALFAEGKEDEALEVIEAAVEYMENSQVIVDEETSNEEEDDTDLEDGTDSEDEAKSDEDTDSEEDADSDEQTEDGETPVDDVVAEDPSDEDAEEVIEEEEVVSEDPFEEIEGMLRQNIIALKAAMEHVGNENARAQLQKNIDKTYAKMAKKLAKLEEKYAEKPVEEEEDTQTTEPVELEPVVESDLQPADETPEEQAEDTMPADDDTTVVPVVAPVKAEKQQAKQERKAEKAAVKQERKAAKQEVKQQKNEAKHHGKQKSQSKGNEGKGHGKGNDKH